MSSDKKSSKSSKRPKVDLMLTNADTPLSSSTSKLSLLSPSGGCRTPTAPEMDKLDVSAHFLKEVSTYQEEETTTSGNFSLNNSQNMEAEVVREFLKRESFRN